MKTVGTRELKQNPQKVIQRIRESGDDYEITFHGHPTGVRMVPDRAAPQRWVPAADLESIPPLSPEESAAWRRDIEDAVEDEISDPWERS